MSDEVFCGVSEAFTALCLLLVRNRLHLHFQDDVVPVRGVVSEVDFE